MTPAQPIAIRSPELAETPKARLRGELDTRAAAAADFVERLSEAADAAGCTLLFELPAKLVSAGAQRAAAFATGAEDGFLYAALGESGEWQVFEGEELDDTLGHLTRSYAGVLGMLAPRPLPPGPASLN